MSGEHQISQQDIALLLFVLFSLSGLAYPYRLQGKSCLEVSLLSSFSQGLLWAESLPSGSSFGLNTRIWKNMTLIKFGKEFLVVCLRRWQINRKKVFCCLTLCIDIVIQGLGFQAIGSHGKVNSSAPTQLLSRSSPIMPLLIQSMPWSVWSVYPLTLAYTYTELETRGKRFHWNHHKFTIIVWGLVTI